MIPAAALAALLAASAAQVVDPGAPVAEFANCIDLEPNYDLRLMYTLVGNTLTMATVSTAVQGFHSVGLIPSGQKMHPEPGVIADLWVTSGLTVTDVNVVGLAAVEDINNLQNPEVTAGETHITSRFSRLTQTGDIIGDVDILPETAGVDVMWACNPLTPAAGATVPQHAADCYGQKSVTFTAAAGTQTCATVSGSFNDGPFKLDWTFAPTFDSITFTAESGTAGWVGFGWTEGLAPHAATDMYVGWVDLAGTPTILDTYSNAVAAPPPDAQQDVLLPTGQELNGKTTITFTRPLVTGDLLDQPIRNIDVLMQWGTNVADGIGQTFPQHDNRGSGTANFFNTKRSGGNTGGGGGGSGGGLSGGIDPLLVVGIVGGIGLVAGGVYYRNKLEKGGGGRGPSHNEGYRQAPSRV